MPSIEATKQLMNHKDIALVLATGGSGMVKSAYSTGKPALGVGPGNVPTYIEKTAHIKRAVNDIIGSKTFVLPQKMKFLDAQRTSILLWLHPLPNRHRVQ